MATPSASTSAPLPAALPASVGEAKNEADKPAVDGQDAEMKVENIEASGPVSVVPPVTEPILERCSSAALVSVTF